jgi:3-oxoadipate enol-lactonase
MSNAPPNPMAMPDGTQIAWEEAGSGPPVVLVHGLGSHRGRWEVQMPALLAAGFRVIRLDMRGFGESRSALDVYAMPELLDDLERFVDGVGLDTFHLVGHSLGGMVTLSYAVKHPKRLRSLTAASTTSHNGRRASAFAKVMVWFSEYGLDGAMAREDIRPQIDSALKEAFPMTDEPPLDMLRVGLSEPDPSRANGWRACDGFSVVDDVERIECPMLITHGTADPLIPFRCGELLHQARPVAVWVPEEGAGHSITKSRAESFTKNLIDLLQRAESALESGAA